jgi:hypothetical protein
MEAKMEPSMNQGMPDECIRILEMMGLGRVLEAISLIRFHSP